jgi:hypothetical protein
MLRFIYLYLFLVVGFYASAQSVTDNFTDGNFTSNPTWAGDNAEFIVNVSKQLQVNNTVAGASYLSTPSPTSSLNNMEWHFYIKQSFAGSSSNSGRVYLASNQANLEGALNGYYLQFGEAGSLDAVELFKQTGTSSTSVVRGTNGEIAGSFTIGVKVTRSAAGLWSLYVDPAGGTAYNLEISATDNTYITTNFFGVTSVYTSSNANKFFYDDFYNGPIVVDLTPPTIISATVLSSTAVDVLFSESVDLTTCQMVTNYSTSNGLGNPVSATRDGSNQAIVHLVYAGTFSSGLSNTLTISNVKDLNANTMITAAAFFTYYAPATASFKDVIITEIFADPSPQIGLPNAEFIEIYNRSSSTFNLNGWKFTDGTSSGTLGSYNLTPNSYLVLCANADTALFSAYSNRMGLGTWPSLNNSGDHLYLKDNTLAFTDSVEFSDTWFQDDTKKSGGWTLELINPNASVNCAPSSNWIASVNSSGGTPGTQNSVYSTAADVTAPSVTSITVVDSLHLNVCFSEAIDMSQISLPANFSINNGIGAAIMDTVNTIQTCTYLTLATPLVPGTIYLLNFSNMGDCSGNMLTPSSVNFSANKIKAFDVVINEVMADPDPIVNLPDYEYIELYNRTAYPINLTNWQYTYGSTTKLLPDVTIAADSFIVLTSAAAAPLFGAGISVVGLSSFSLTNSGETLILKTSDGTTISTITYADTWYRNTTKMNGGWSIEQIDPNNPCAGAPNWKASVNVNGGTPGTRNSVNAVNADATPPQVTRVSVLAVDTIRLYFNEPLDSVTMANLSIYSIDNGIGNPTQVVPVTPDFKSVRLTLATILQVGITYHITVNNAITDCTGNALGVDNTARFALPEAAIPNDIVINEILYNPKIDGVDFVEIYNRSNKVIDLKTMTLSQYDTVNNMQVSIYDIADDGYLIFPQDYLVLSTNGDAIKNQYNTTNSKGFLDMGSIPTMSISGGTVCLSTSTNLIDLFKYYDDMQFPLLIDSKGVSLERIDYNRTTQDATNWHSAAANVGYATPAYKNSQYNDAGETDNSIEVTPQVFSPDEDGVNDIVNINYNFSTPGFIGNITIYDSKGRIVKHLVRSQLLAIKGTYSWDGISDENEKVHLGIYVVFVEVFDLTGTVKQYKKTCVVAGKLQ